MTTIGAVAAVVVTWQTPQLTRSLLDHLCFHWPDLDVVLVECGAESHEPYPRRVTVLRQGNLGYAGGNNAGIQAALDAGKRYVLVLNSDAVPLPGSIELLVEALDDNPTIAACGATLVSWTSCGVEFNTGSIFDWRRGVTRSMRSSAPAYSVGFCCGAALLLRGRSVEETGGFDSNLFLYYEDLDWAERVRAAGGSVHVSREARALHNGSVSTKRASKAAAYYRARNRLWVLRRYGATHGDVPSILREAVHAAKSLMSDVLSGDLSVLVARVRGTARGLFGSVPPVTDEPLVALRQQRFELKKAARRRRAGGWIGRGGAAEEIDRQVRSTHEGASSLDGR